MKSSEQVRGMMPLSGPSVCVGSVWGTSEGGEGVERTAHHAVKSMSRAGEGPREGTYLYDLPDPTTHR